MARRPEEASREKTRPPPVSRGSSPWKYFIEKMFIIALDLHPTCWIRGGGNNIGHSMHMLPCLMNTVTLNMYISMSYTAFTRRNTLLFLWLCPRNTWILIEHVGPPSLPQFRFSPSQTVYIQRAHEHTRTGNWSESGFGSPRGVPLDISRCLVASAPSLWRCSAATK